MRSAEKKQEGRLYGHRAPRPQILCVILRKVVEVGASPCSAGLSVWARRKRMLLPFRGELPEVDGASRQNKMN